MSGSPRSEVSHAPLSRSERDAIAAAIGRAEADTSGEIVVVVAARAGLYRSVALALALFAGLAVPWPLIALTALSAAWIALIQAGAMLAVLLATLDARVRVALVPRAVRRNRARVAARREFFGRGLTRTRGGTGVLIYVALAERYAEIVADSAVRARVPDARWRGTLADLLAAAARGELAAGLTRTVEEAGAILAAELPRGPEGDELPNRVIVLD